MRYDFEQLFVVPDVIFTRGNVEISADDFLLSGIVATMVLPVFGKKTLIWRASALPTQLCLFSPQKGIELKMATPL